MMTPEFQELLEEFFSLQKQAGESFKVQALKFLRDNNVAAMRWVQYAPDYNNGKTCKFEVRSAAQLRAPGEAFDEAEFEPAGNSALERESWAFLRMPHPEVLYQLFGTDVEVVASLEGEPFTVFDFDHED